MIHGRTTSVMAGLGLLLVILSGCGGSSDNAKKTVALMNERNTTVTSEVIKPTSYSLYLTQPGTTYAIRNVDLDSRVTGYIESVDFTDGQLVKAGDRLFQLDPRPFEAALLQARGQLESAVAQRNLAERNVQRNRPLVESGAISRESFDTLVTDLEVAEGSVESAAGQLVDAELNLSYTTITAPFDGKLGQRNYEEGALVEQGGNQTLVTIVQYHPMRILVSVAAEQLPTLRALRDKGPIRADVRVNGTRGGGGRVFTGEVDFIDNQVSQSTSTFTVRVRFPNPDAWAFPGQYGEADILIREVPDAIVVPQKSVLLQQGGKQFVWVIDEKGVVESKLVTVGNTNDGKSWITKGLKSGDKIVVDSSGQLAGGDKVTIVSRSTFSKEQESSSMGSSKHSSTSTDHSNHSDTSDQATKKNGTTSSGK
ncbi:MAG: efflux RND transporter periplasmic adaptor subunit [Planctomycetota bacterium]|nr:efflux RND transporter periplasmic adaptor subunit [Planctomycetota bacterium]